MANAETIRIDTYKPISTAVTTLRQGVFWSYLVGSEYASYRLFGGSWVVDLIIITVLMLFVNEKSMVLSGHAVRLSPNEIREWVTAGMPRDVKAWKDARRVSQ